jgi:hypothetical protein
VTVDAGETSDVMTILSSNSSTTANYWVDHPAEDRVLDYVADMRGRERDERMEKYFPVYKILPFTGPGYSINFGEMPEAKGRSGFAIFVTCDPSSISMAKCRWVTESVISDGGYNPSDYTISYRAGTVPGPS